MIVDLDVMDRNITSYVDYTEQNDCQLRSHVKTYKTPDIGRLQDELSSGGIVCQTLSEVEAMAYNGLTDIYLSYMVVGERKLRRAAHLAKKLDRFTGTVDPDLVLPVHYDTFDPIETDAEAFADELRAEGISVELF